MTEIKKAIVPAAGVGTRLRPLACCIAKELLMIRNKPLIHYSADECVSPEPECNPIGGIPA